MSLKTSNKSAENKTKAANNLARYNFKPGQSGNPGGRPKKTEEQIQLESACRAKTKDALDTILVLMRSADKDSVKLSAAQFVIERGWGKAVQRNEHTGIDGEPIEHRIIAEIVTGKAVTRG